MKVILEFPFNGDGYKIFHKKEGRWYIYFTKDTGKKSMTSFARYLMSVKEKRFLNKDEHVDHINNIKDDDRIENLQILTQKENTRKSFLKCKNVICPTCKKEFFQPRVIRIYCSKKCARQNPIELENKKVKEYLGIKQLPHGTKNCYSYHKCRCVLCTEAHRLAIKKYKDNLL